MGTSTFGSKDWVHHLSNRSHFFPSELTMIFRIEVANVTMRCNKFLEVWSLRNKIRLCEKESPTAARSLVLLIITAISIIWIVITVRLWVICVKHNKFTWLWGYDMVLRVTFGVIRACFLTLGSRSCSAGQVASVRSRSQAPGGCGMIAVRSVYVSTASINWVTWLGGHAPPFHR